MLTVKINVSGFDYDVHSLVKAFFPREDVIILRTGAAGGEASPLFEIRFCGEEVLLLSGSHVKKEQTAGLDRAEVKSLLKRQIYAFLSEKTGRLLPWGTLTGIRPTKLPMGMLEKGRTPEEIREWMRRTYLISGEKLDLSLEIALREREITRGLHGRDGYSLYIGIPFCPTTCLYCSFTSFPIGRWRERTGEYLDALEREMALTSEVYAGKFIDTVYIGGGTPTTLSAPELDRLLSMVRSYFPVEGLLEWTVEAGRPDSITGEKLKVLKEHRISRISINPQTMKDETLKLIGRQHTADQVREAFLTARDMGFDNINMDFILGLPGEDAGDVERTMEEAAALGPDSLTVHSLAVKRASRLGEWMKEHPEAAMRNDETVMAAADRAARAMGMDPYYLYRQKNMAGNYENTGYAKPGKYGLYNIVTMQEKQSVAALGAGSVSKEVYGDGRIERADNYKDVALYLGQIDEVIRKKSLFYHKGEQADGTE